MFGPGSGNPCPPDGLGPNLNGNQLRWVVYSLYSLGIYKLRFLNLPFSALFCPPLCYSSPYIFRLNIFRLNKKLEYQSSQEVFEVDWQYVDPNEPRYCICNMVCHMTWSGNHIALFYFLSAIIFSYYFHFILLLPTLLFVNYTILFLTTLKSPQKL